MSSPKKTSPTREDLIRRAEIELSGDIYTLKASEVYEVPPEQVTPKQRQYMKEAMFATSYAMTEEMLSERLKMNEVSVKRLREKLSADIPALRKFQEERASTRHAPSRQTARRGLPGLTRYYRKNT
jgi:DNA polymerase I-like protein with 3'-5' exonuclease and polymerase domains